MMREFWCWMNLINYIHTLIGSHSITSRLICISSLYMHYSECFLMYLHLWFFIREEVFCFDLIHFSSLLFLISDLECFSTPSMCLPFIWLFWNHLLFLRWAILRRDCLTFSSSRNSLQGQFQRAGGLHWFFRWPSAPRGGVPAVHVHGDRIHGLRRGAAGTLSLTV